MEQGIEDEGMMEEMYCVLNEDEHDVLCVFCSV